MSYMDNLYVDGLQNLQNALYGSVYYCWQNTQWGVWLVECLHYNEQKSAGNEMHYNEQKSVGNGKKKMQMTYFFLNLFINDSWPENILNKRGKTERKTRE